MKRYRQIQPHLIGFDFDCVVADTMEAFIRVAAADYGIKVRPEDITSYQVENCLDLPQSIISEIFIRLLDFPIENDLKPMPYAISVLTELSADARVTFITARPQKEPVEKWLASYFSPEACCNFRLIATGSHDGKSRYLKELGLQFFVDDRIETCLELALAGFSPIVFSHPWNRGRHSFACTDSWLDIKERIFRP